jgi:hypothetical protein
MVAAYELGVRRLPEIPPYWFDQDFVVSNAMESAIYVITCRNGVGFSEYSMPDGIARAAQGLGLGVTAYMSGCLVPPLLRRAYPQVFDALGDLNVEIEQGTPALEDDQRMLVVVSVGGLGLHYVLYRPDGTYMDPAYGNNHAGTLWGMGQLGGLLRYVDTGIYLVIGGPGV